MADSQRQLPGRSSRAVNLKSWGAVQIREKVKPLPPQVSRNGYTLFKSPLLHGGNEISGRIRFC